MSASEALPLDADLRRRPIRELRAVLTRLGKPIAGCVERNDFVSAIMDATISELVAALGSHASKGQQEKTALLRQLLDTSAETAAAEPSQEQLLPGSTVRLFNLQSAPALNMQRAKVVRYDPGSDRYEVRLDWDGSIKKVRYDNLQEEEPATPPSDATSAVEADDLRQQVDATHAAEANTTAAVDADTTSAAFAPAMPASCATESPGIVIAMPVIPTPADATCEPAELPPTVACAASTLAATIPCVTGAVPCQGVPTVDVLQSAAAMAEPAAIASPERKRKLQAASAVSPTDSLAESLVEAIAVECGLEEACQEEIGAASVTAPCQEVIESCVEAKSVPPAEVLSCRAAEPASRLDDTTNTQEIFTKAAAIPAPPFAFPMAAGKCQETTFSATGHSSSSSLPKKGAATKALKLRVGYDSGRHAVEEGSLLAQGLRELWRTGELCDVSLACRESTYRVHRVVLACRSSELRDFVGDRSEVQMPDVSYPESVQILVEFLYEAEGEKGYAPSCGEVNMEVLELAHRFRLSSLKRRAAAFMAQGLTTDNVVRSLNDCDTFALQDLKDKIISHLAVNKKVLAEITGGPYISNYPDLLRQILVRVASPKDHGGPSKRARVAQG